MINSFTGKYRWLSNFYPAKVVLDGETYPTVEHAFQAAKSLDPVVRSEIRKINKYEPRLAKKAGRRTALRPDWNDVKEDIMLDLVRQKFIGPDTLGHLLLETGDAILEEGNHWGDTYWGTVDGFGRNALGQILMQVRDECAKLCECESSGSTQAASR
jgi:ribA/ribD-fused uncharacterized protein